VIGKDKLGNTKKYSAVMHVTRDKICNPIDREIPLYLSSYKYKIIKAIYFIFMYKLYSDKRLSIGTVMEQQKEKDCTV
jgi:hypothetical protein